MKIRKINMDSFTSNKKIIKVNEFIKNGYVYTIYMYENTNLMKVSKEDIKGEFFEIEFFEII